MKKIDLYCASFNVLNHDQDGARVQRIWFENYHNLGVDLGKTKKRL